MNDAGILDLPNDPILLKRMISERDAAIAQIKREAAETIEAMTQRHKAEMAAVLRRFYGPRSEAFDPTQLLLFGLAVAPDTPIDPQSDEARAAEAESGRKLTTRRIQVVPARGGRHELPAHLPRIEVRHDLTDEQKLCPCCDEPRVCIGSQSSEQLEFVAATFKVLKHVRNKYACKTCGKGCQHCDGSPHIEMATKAAQPIEKGLPGPGLLAHIAVSKMQDHLPLYRLEQIYGRIGVDIARSTMCSWMMNCGMLVQPLVGLMTRRIMQSKAIHTDDTPVPVQDDTVKGKCKSGRIWCFLGDESNPYDVFHYTPDRTRAGPQNFLADYQGHLQADAYGGYDGIYTRGNVTEVACMAHARRKFFEAKETDGRRSAQMLRFVQRLYAIEDRIKLRIERRSGSSGAVLAMAQRHEITRQTRQARSVPILNQMKAWLDTEQKLVLPRSPIAAAITYMLNQWIALCAYTTEGFLNIDNNAAERALKRVAIGRKNWLFAGNDPAGKSHANLYTLLASAQRHGLDPQKYMMSVLSKIGQTKVSELDQFLPDKWKAQDAADKPPSAPAE
jgi:transposase